MQKMIEIHHDLQNISHRQDLNTQEYYFWCPQIKAKDDDVVVNCVESCCEI